MTSPHPDLARLEQQYDQLVSAAEAGHISQADAVATLAGLSVTDAAGAVWAINADGDYVRAQFPGAPAQLANPAEFATNAAAPQPYLTDTASPAGFSTSQPAAAEFPTMSASPGFPSPSPFPSAPMPPQTPSWGSGGAGDPLAAPPAGFSPEAAMMVPATTGAIPSAANQVPDITPPAPVYPDPTYAESSYAESVRSLAQAGAPSAVASIVNRVKDLIVANKVLAAIVGIALVIFVVLGTHTGGTKNQTTKIPAGDQTSTSGSTPDDPSTSMPTGDASTSDGAATTVPTKAMAVNMISALSSGRRDLVSGSVVSSPSTAAAAKAAAEWVGVKSTGLTVTPGAAAAQGQGAIQNWVVTEGTTTVATVKVTWILAGGTWKLAALPVL